MRVTAKVDYAVRAAIVLAEASLAGTGPVKGEAIGDRQDIPVKYLESILSELRQAGIVRSQRGSAGGYWLAKPPGEVSVADVIRAAEGPLATVRGERAESLAYPEGSGALRDLWVIVRSALRGVLEEVTLEHLVTGELPKHARSLLVEPRTWAPR
jgi:Rrf2 family protein